MKCHAGVEFPSGKPCPRCNAKLGEVCWPGINADLAELSRIKKDIKAYADVCLSEENDRLIAAIEHARKHINSNPLEAELILLRARPGLAVSSQKPNIP